MMRQTIFEKRKRQTPKMTFVFVLTCELELHVCYSAACCQRFARVRERLEIARLKLK